MDPIAALAEFENAALEAIRTADNAEKLEAARVEFLGQKKGRLRDLQSLLGKVDKEQRPVVGKRFNEVKTLLSETLDRRKAELERPRSAAAGLDVTLPGTPVEIGRRHPLTQTIEEFKDIMGRFGFSVVEGPEIEDERHNFEALNIPADHPARDPLDNFYLATARIGAGTGSGRPSTSNPAVAPSPAACPSERATDGPVLLRSQTSTVQIRTMEQTKPPIRIVSIGRVYRPDAIDATHSVMFHQMEGLMVGEGVTMAQLKTVLSLFAAAYLGHGVEIRFRPSFFPFTEPSVEVDMSWNDGWLEIGGAGMVDPNVLRAVGYDPEQVTGFAFGLGVERFCLRRHGINDIRRFYENDVRFLRQF